MGAMIRLQWVRYPNGFKVDDSGRLVLRKPGRSELYLLEGTTSRVFLDLANVGASTESVLTFVDRWGLLFTNRGSAKVTVVTHHAETMREAIEEAQRSSAAEDLDKLLFTHGLHTSLSMRWAKLPGDSAPRFFLKPEGLWYFCCAELLQLVDAGTEIRRCPRCGTLFAIGKVGKPPMYCSAACKVAMHRKAKRALELRASNVVRLRAGAARR